MDVAGLVHYAYPKKKIQRKISLRLLGIAAHGIPPNNAGTRIGCMHRAGLPRACTKNSTGRLPGKVGNRKLPFSTKNRRTAAMTPLQTVLTQSSSPGIDNA